MADVTGFCYNCGPFIDELHFTDAMQFVRDRVAEIARLLHDHDASSAEAVCLKLSEMDPTNGPVFALLGDIYRLRGQTLAAATAYQEALARDPLHADLLRARLDALIDEARQHARSEPQPVQRPLPPPEHQPIQSSPAEQTIEIAARAGTPEHIVIHGAPEPQAPSTSAEMPETLLGLPVSRVQIRVIMVAGIILALLALLLSLAPWRSHYLAPTHVTPLSLTNEEETPATATPTVNRQSLLPAFSRPDTSYHDARKGGHE